MDNLHALTDHIYAALLGESSWQVFLDQFRNLAPNGKAFLYFHDAAAGFGALPLSSGVEACDMESYRSYYSAKNPWMPAATTRPLGKVLRAEAMLATERLTRTEFYNDWLRPLDLRTGLGVTIFRESGCNFLLSLNSAELGDEEAVRATRQMQELVPHLRRAFGYYRRDQNSAATLFSGRGLSDALGVGIVRLGRGAKLGWANKTATQLLERSVGLFVDSAGIFHCTSPTAMEFIDSVLGAWAKPRVVSAAKSFLVGSGEGLLPLRVTVLAPKRDAERAFFVGPEGILLIEDTRLDTDAAAEEMGQLYGFTAAEKRIVAGLAAGLTVEEIATRAGVSPGTVRVQMKSVFEKSGLHRQVDVVQQACALAGRLVQSDCNGESASYKRANPRPQRPT